MLKRLDLLAAATILALTSGCGQSAPPPAATAPAASTAAKPSTAPATEQAKTPPGEQPAPNEALVTVNGQPVTMEMFGIYFNDRTQRAPGTPNSPQLQSQAINELINMLVLAQEARNQGIERLPNVQTSLNLQRDQLLSRFLLQQQAQQRQPTDEELKAAYDDRFIKQAQEEYKARHILVQTEEEAKTIAGQLASGADFAELAAKHSMDSTGKNGGDLGWFSPNQMVEPFAAAVSKLAVGARTDSPVQTKFGWHVIQLDEKRHKDVPTFDAVKQQLVAAQQNRLLADFVSGLRDKAKIELSAHLTAQPAEPAKAAAEKPAAK